MNRFRQQLTTLDKLIPGSSSSQRKNPTRAAVVAARATKRQHSRTDVSDNRVQSANESPEKNNPINRKLRYVNHVGAQFEEGSNEFQRFVEKYISEHDGDGFRKPDIESALNFLRTLDLSKRTVPGVIQLKGQRLNYSSTGEKLPVYELKPKEAGSLVETKSKHGDKVRIDFVVLPDGEVAIVKIYDRARVDVTSRKKIQNKYKPSNHSSCVAVDK